MFNYSLPCVYHVVTQFPYSDTSCFFSEMKETPQRVASKLQNGPTLAPPPPPHGRHIQAMYV